MSESKPMSTALTALTYFNCTEGREAMAELRKQDSRGAMTAQQFARVWEGDNPGKRADWCWDEFAVAFSAHNTAAVTKQDEDRLREAAERAGVGWFGCDTPDHLAEKVLELQAELTRLRSQGAGQWEAGRDAAAQYMEKATCKEGFYATQIRALQPPTGLASPPEGDQQKCALCLQPMPDPMKHWSECTGARKKV